ncbi:hypothetical protein GCM10011320_00040 [Neoroseomonas lacus]|uniref:Uncharacterized protein n=1 Tax=Neoroseomonas lacus TaxID=287609 RepID=A0A917K397_9PROT|nr:hypothetical protein GCM10011320_00040 [Neoroseomonas lacus]
MNVAKKIGETHDVVMHGSESAFGSRVAWPRAALTILGVSLALWGVVVAIFSVAIG